MPNCVQLCKRVRVPDVQFSFFENKEKSVNSTCMIIATIETIEAVITISSVISNTISSPNIHSTVYALVI